MSKIFKTISLEERLKASQYNDISQKPNKVDQGDIDLKLIVDAKGKNSEILKAYARGRADQALPTIQAPEQKSLASYDIPFANVKFRTSINLSDRLKQPALQTTSHLPQFFLSDVYTDYIKITPFGIFEHTSDIVIANPSTKVSQGGLSPIFPVFDSLSAQGAVGVNGYYTSLVVVKQPTTDILVSQGTFFTNGAYLSQVNVENSVEPGSFNQGGTDPIAAVGLLSIQFAQGVLNVNNTLTSIVSLTTPTPALFEQKYAIARQGAEVLPINDFQQAIIISQGSVKLPTETFQIDVNPEQGSTTPTAFTFQPNRTSPVIELLQYEADRLLARFAPRVKHGSAILQVVDFSQKTFDQGESEKENTPYQSASPNLGSNSKSIEKTLTEGGDDASDTIQQLVKFPDGSTSLSDYKKISYGEIVKKVKENRTTQPALPMSSGNPAKQGQSDADTPGFINFSVTSVRDGVTVKLKPYITTLSDSFTINWNDINYVGRQDTLKAFKGVTRGLSVGFKMAALTEQDLGIIYSKLNNLVKITAIGNVDGGTYIQGPICKITLGKWFAGVYCVFNSLKIDTQPAEYTWDIDKQMPHIVDVTFDISILTDNGNRLLNASNNKFFNV
jgi:hypothetical protein